MAIPKYMYLIVVKGGPANGRVFIPHHPQAYLYACFDTLKYARIFLEKFPQGEAHIKKIQVTILKDKREK